jgi:hypothetical protein
MDIGPISAISPVTMVKPSPVAPDLSRVFEVEYLGHTPDDEYTPANRKAARGLEDEEDESEADESSDAPTSSQPTSFGKVSFFA